MALDKPSKYWRIRITAPDGRRIQRSSRTEDRKEAEQLEAKIKNDLWRIHKLGEKPERLWQEAVIRWRREGIGRPKESLYVEQTHLDWLDKYLKNKILSQINADLLEEIAKKKESEFIEKRRKGEEDKDYFKRCKSHPSAATINRIIGLVRSILRRAKNQWGWIDNIPHVRMRKENEGVIRWITRDEADRLITELPEHLATMVTFTLATGLRKNNVTNLKWRNVDLIKKHAYIDAPDAKGRRSIAVPLNEDAILCLRKQIGKHPEYIFVYMHPATRQYTPVKECNGKAWRKALKRAGIKNFRWHDLRHTWASWHIQNGTPLPVLKELGAWRDFEMVLRYAHLNSDQLKDAAENISGAKLVQRGLKLISNNR